MYVDKATLYLVQDGGCWPDEGPLDIFLTLGRCLNIQHLIVPRKFECLIPRHHPFIEQIALIPHQHHNDIFIAIILDIFNPSCTVAKCLLTGNIKDHQRCSRRPIVRPRDGLELFLPSSIPNLQFNCLAVDRDVLGGKLHPHCELVILIEPVLHEATDDAGLADPSIAHQDELERVVESCHAHSGYQYY